MFGLSPTKILFTIAVIVVVWYGFKLLGRYQKIQKERARDVSRKGTDKAAKGSKDADYEELVACSVCGDFVVKDKKAGCGKKNCPYER